LQFKSKGGNQTLAARARAAGLEPAALAILTGDGNRRGIKTLIYFSGLQLWLSRMMSKEINENEKRFRALPINL
jgi:hypothetical protein